MPLRMQRQSGMHLAFLSTKRYESLNPSLKVADTHIALKET